MKAMLLPQLKAGAVQLQLLEGSLAAAAPGNVPQRGHSAAPPLLWATQHKHKHARDNTIIRPAQ